MLFAVKMALAAATGACVAVPLGLATVGPGLPGNEAAWSLSEPAMVEIRAGDFRYRRSGEFTRGGRPTRALAINARIDRTFSIMAHQVTAADYQDCVQDGGCPRRPAGAPASADRPAVQVSWRDAEAYAAWLSRRTGAHYRLPSDQEWAFAAADRFADDALPDSDGGDPSARWLARYESESAREDAVDKEPQPLGSFGRNENGVADMAGNVWEWTSTCYSRTALDARDHETGMGIVNCGVRVVEGRHRTYMTDFIRDPRTGGCAVGTPPSNLGFRLVLDDDGWGRVRRAVARAGRWLTPRV